MKKIILPALAVLLIGSVASAQAPQKQAVKNASLTTSKPAAGTTLHKTASVSPQKTTAASTNKNAVIRKKHHPKGKKQKK